MGILNVPFSEKQVIADQFIHRDLAPHLTLLRPTGAEREFEVWPSERLEVAERGITFSPKRRIERITSASADCRN